jgi:hypothetical protein
MSSQSFNRKMNERIVPVGYLSTLIGATSAVVNALRFQFPSYLK